MLWTLRTPPFFLRREIESEPRNLLERHHLVLDSREVPQRLFKKWVHVHELLLVLKFDFLLLALRIELAKVIIALVFEPLNFYDGLAEQFLLEELFVLELICKVHLEVAVRGGRRSRGSHRDPEVELLRGELFL